MNNRANATSHPAARATTRNKFLSRMMNDLIFADQVNATKSHVTKLHGNDGTGEQEQTEIDR